jgi:GH18 family chitinase
MSFDATSNMHVLAIVLLLLFQSSKVVVYSQEVLAAYLDVSQNTNKNTLDDLSSKALLLTDLYLFSIGPDEQGNLVLPDEYKSIFETARQVRKWKTTQQIKEEQPPQLRLWITIGGGAKSEAFGKVTSSRETRQNLIQSVKKLW